MADEPIDVVPGVYTIPGKPEVMGLCIMIDDQDAKWEVTTTDHYTTTIKIKNGAKWNVQEYTDPKTGKRKIQIFREGAKLNRLAQEFIHPTEKAYSQGPGETKGEGPQLKIFYSTPEDSHKPPVKKPKP
ncbi:MAG TPA: hypothetical protein VFS27_04935 [Blastocatellia bacterium]|jgi:hypothetical protein|nr:hypothetical protein [Blastocatellia bacterium]